MITKSHYLCKRPDSTFRQQEAGDCRRVPRAISAPSLGTTSAPSVWAATPGCHCCFVAVNCGRRFCGPAHQSAYCHSFVVALMSCTCMLQSPSSDGGALCSACRWRRRAKEHAQRSRSQRPRAQPFPRHGDKAEARSQTFQILCIKDTHLHFAQLHAARGAGGLCLRCGLQRMRYCLRGICWRSSGTREVLFVLFERRVQRRILRRPFRHRLL
jgi:hypothetical protein